MHRLVVQHISEWDNKSSVNLAPKMMALTLEIVSQCLFGLDSFKYTAQIVHSMEHIRDEVLTLILSEHETTANVLTWAFSYMSNNPQAAVNASGNPLPLQSHN